MTPRSEQEAIIRYDAQENKWYYYSDVPKLNRKYAKAITNITQKEVEGDNIVTLEGTIDGSVSVHKRRSLTKEQREAMAKRLKKAREKLQ